MEVERGEGGVTVEALAAEMIKRHQRLDAIFYCAGLVLRKRMVSRGDRDSPGSAVCGQVSPQ